MPSDLPRLAREISEEARAWRSDAWLLKIEVDRRHAVLGFRVRCRVQSKANCVPSSRSEPAPWRAEVDHKSRSRGLLTARKQIERGSVLALTALADVAARMCIVEHAREKGGSGKQRLHCLSRLFGISTLVGR